MKTWIKNPLAVWTGNDLDAAHGLVVENNVITQVLSVGESPDGDVDHVFDASDLVVLPGLVNCHHHFYQTLTRAFPTALNKELFPWLRSLYPVWAGLDEEAIELSSRLALAELMLSGCTLACDHHYVFSSNLEQAVDIQIGVARELGVRAILTRGSMSLGESHGGLPPDTIVETEQQILDDSERLIRTHHDPSPLSMIQIALAPCSPFSVTPELMRQSSQLADEHGVLLHTHLAETLDENQFCLDRVGKRPVAYMEDLGWIRPGVWFAHGIHFEPQEIQVLGQAGVGVAHCPSSNMILASGICPTRDLEDAGVHVGLGVDGSASNDCSNLIQEVRQAFLLQRIRYGSANISHTDALRWGTTGGAAVLNRDRLGSLAPGQAADLGFYDLRELRFSGSGDPIAALVLCGANSVEHLMIDGVWRIKNRKLLGVDLDELRAKHSEIASRLARKTNI